MGHPTRLYGDPARIEADCRAAIAAGCPGVDLLAYRAEEADPVELIRAARRGLGDDGYLIVAGSIDSPERIRAVKASGASAFTIGSAIFEEAFAPGVKGVRGQCEAVLAALAR
jgi:putative N-acetylmannosamine-6-phosphate epimerase